MPLVTVIIWASKHENIKIVFYVPQNSLIMTTLKKDKTLIYTHFENVLASWLSFSQLNEWVNDWNLKKCLLWITITQTTSIHSFNLHNSILREGHFWDGKLRYRSQNYFKTGLRQYLLLFGCKYSISLFSDL